MLFDKKAAILKLAETEPNTYAWVENKSLWVNLEHRDKLHSYKLNLFSRVGIGTKSVVFTARKISGIDLHCAIQYKGKQYFITDINSDSPLYMTITTADIQPLSCVATRSDEKEGPNKSSIMETSELSRFPAVMTEKYMGFKQEEPMAQTTVTFVLVTPKPVILEENDLVSIENSGKYAVIACHMLDEYKNEYEITRKEDV